jgi:hypothetical protein
MTTLGNSGGLTRHESRLDMNSGELEHPDVLLLRDKRVLRINITRQGNQSNPLDVKYVTSLLKIAAEAGFDP